jgi:hypothetical protein|tara:strand:- start:851 stop:1120 length:270 start_codon:yes stop_codon:yes gene_type:complete
MEQEIKILILVNGNHIISQVEEIAALDIGDPNCKLISPYTVNPLNGDLHPWLSEVTDDTEIMMSSDKILTLVEPHKSLVDSYLKLAITE